MFSDVYDSLCSAFKAYGCPAQLLLGPQWLDQHTSALRIVFVQGDDTFGPVTVSVPQGTNGYNRQGINPRPIAQRVSAVTAQLWATAPTQRDPAAQYRADLAFLDALINTLLAALQQIAAGVTIVSGGQAAANNSESGRAGLGYTLQFSVGVPVTDSPWPAQQLSLCSRTWTEGPATADVSVQQSPGNQTSPPTFRVPTPLTPEA